MIPGDLPSLSHEFTVKGKVRVSASLLRAVGSLEREAHSCLSRPRAGSPTMDIPACLVSFHRLFLLLTFDTARTSVRSSETCFSSVHQKCRQADGSLGAQRIGKSPALQPPVCKATGTGH